MKLLIKSMSFKPTAQLKRAIAADAKAQQRSEGDVMRRRLLQAYGLLPNGERPLDA